MREEQKMRKKAELLRQNEEAQLKYEEEQKIVYETALNEKASRISQIENELKTLNEQYEYLKQTNPRERKNKMALEAQMKELREELRKLNRRSGGGTHRNKIYRKHKATKKQSYYPNKLTKRVIKYKQHKYTKKQSN